MLDMNARKYTSPHDDEVRMDFAKLLKENADIYTGECSCRKAVSIDKIFELLKQINKIE